MIMIFVSRFTFFCASSILFDLFYGRPGFVRASKDEIDNYLTTKNTGCQNKADTNKTKHRCHNGWLSDGKYRWDGTWTAQTKKKQCIRNNSLSDFVVAKTVLRTVVPIWKPQFNFHVYLNSNLTIILKYSIIYPVSVAQISSTLVSDHHTCSK